MFIHFLFIFINLFFKYYSPLGGIMNQAKSKRSSFKKKTGRNFALPPQESSDALVLVSNKYHYIDEYYVKHSINCLITNNWISAYMD